jgi:hypothetical protein
VVIGVDTYGAGVAKLDSPVADATALADALERDHGFEVWRLVEREASLAELRALLSTRLPGALGARDRLLLYFAGHGVALEGEQGPEGYLLPAGAARDRADEYLPMRELHDALLALPVRHALLVLDCCFAGALRWSTWKNVGRGRGQLYRERYDHFVESAAWQVLTSASQSQLALDLLANDRGGEGQPHSPFARALLEGLAGAADYTKDQIITADELEIYVRERTVAAAAGAAMRQVPQLFPLRKHDAGQFVFQVPGSQLSLEGAPALDEDANPYRGLRAFGAGQRELFFGRDRLAAELAAAVAQHPLTVVVGPSGSGKSSLVHAGVLHRLEAGRWRVLPSQQIGRAHV